MAKRIAVSTLNASTIDILNVIRTNATQEYQNNVPEIKNDADIKRVGEAIFGYPALANQFLGALMNRIALVRVKSATFNNAYAELKKGYLEFGETVEEVFVSIAKAREFSAEKAEKREFKRTLPNVQSAFHVMNWQVQYPVSIQQNELRQAFTSIDGVQDLIAKIVNEVYTAAEYDEFLLFKYLLIKAIAKGKMHPISFDSTSMANAGVAFRGTSNKLTFMSNKYNAFGVHTTTPKSDQYIFMDSTFNAQYDVNVLAAAFNMDKADFSGRLKLVDDWTTFDNDRFDVIREESNMLEEVTAEELALMRDVKAVLADKEWFQIYDNLIQFTDTPVASGMYWNYFLNVWKTVSSSPFSNAVVFVAENGNTELPQQINVKVASKDVGDNATVFTLEPQLTVQFVGGNVQFKQTDEASQNAIAVHKYGALIIPKGVNKAITLHATVNGVEYTATTTIGVENNVGDTITLSK